MLELRNLSGGWGPTLIVEDFSLALAAGETVSIIGRNGVGKSTLLELIMGRAQQRGGEIRFNGKDISALPIHDRTISGIGYVPQQREVFPSLTVREHLAIAARQDPRKLCRWNEDAVFTLFPRLAERRQSFGRHLSGGEQQMLAIARALLTNPSVILMDEPSEGLAPIVVAQLEAQLRRLKETGIGILLVEQNMHLALAVADDVTVLEGGHVVYEAEAEAVRADPASLRRFLGV